MPVSSGCGPRNASHPSLPKHRSQTEPQNAPIVVWHGGKFFGKNPRAALRRILQPLPPFRTSLSDGLCYVSPFFRPPDLGALYSPPSPPPSPPPPPQMNFVSRGFHGFVGRPPWPDRPEGCPRWPQATGPAQRARPYRIAAPLRLLLLPFLDHRVPLIRRGNRRHRYPWPRWRPRCRRPPLGRCPCLRRPLRHPAQRLPDAAQEVDVRVRAVRPIPKRSACSPGTTLSLLLPLRSRCPRRPGVPLLSRCFAWSPAPLRCAVGDSAPQKTSRPHRGQYSLMQQCTNILA